MSQPPDPFQQQPGAVPPPPPPGYGPPPGYAQPPGYGQPPAYSGFNPPQPQLALAAWGTRVAGALIDGIITIPVMVVAAIVGGRPLANLASFVIGYLVYPYLESKTGQTPGKRAMGTRLITEAGGVPPSWGLAIGRKLAHLLDAFSLLIGYLWPLWDAKKQTFADKICSTVVVR